MTSRGRDRDRYNVPPLNPNDIEWNTGRQPRDVDGYNKLEREVDSCKSGIKWAAATCVVCFMAIVIVMFLVLLHAVSINKETIDHIETLPVKRSVLYDGTGNNNISDVTISPVVHVSPHIYANSHQNTSSTGGTTHGETSATAGHVNTSSTGGHAGEVDVSGTGQGGEGGQGHAGQVNVSGTGQGGVATGGQGGQGGDGDAHGGLGYGGSSDSNSNSVGNDDAPIDIEAGGQLDNVNISQAAATDSNTATHTGTNTTSDTQTTTDTSTESNNTVWDEEGNIKDNHNSMNHDDTSHGLSGQVHMDGVDWDGMTTVQQQAWIENLANELGVDVSQIQLTGIQSGRRRLLNGGGSTISFTISGISKKKAEISALNLHQGSTHIIGGTNSVFSGITVSQPYQDWASRQTVPHRTHAIIAGEPVILPTTGNILDSGMSITVASTNARFMCYGTSKLEATLPNPSCKGDLCPVKVTGPLGLIHVTPGFLKVIGCADVNSRVKKVQYMRAVDAYLPTFTPPSGSTVALGESIQLMSIHAKGLCYTTSSYQPECFDDGASCKRGVYIATSVGSTFPLSIDTKFKVIGCADKTKTPIPNRDSAIVEGIFKIARVVELPQYFPPTGATLFPGMSVSIMAKYASSLCYTTTEHNPVCSPEGTHCIFGTHIHGYTGATKPLRKGTRLHTIGCTDTTSQPEAGENSAIEDGIYLLVAGSSPESGDYDHDHNYDHSHNRGDEDHNHGHGQPPPAYGTRPWGETININLGPYGAVNRSYSPNAPYGENHHHDYNSDIDYPIGWHPDDDFDGGSRWHPDNGRVWDQHTHHHDDDGGPINYYGEDSRTFGWRDHRHYGQNCSDGTFVCPQGYYCDDVAAFLGHDFGCQETEFVDANGTVIMTRVKNCTLGTFICPPSYVCDREAAIIGNTYGCVKPTDAVDIMYLTIHLIQIPDHLNKTDPDINVNIYNNFFKKPNEQYFSLGIVGRGFYFAVVIPLNETNHIIGLTKLGMFAINDDGYLIDSMGFLLYPNVNIELQPQKKYSIEVHRNGDIVKVEKGWCKECPHIKTLLNQKIMLAYIQADDGLDFYDSYPFYIDCEAEDIRCSRPELDEMPIWYYKTTSDSGNITYVEPWDNHAGYLRPSLAVGHDALYYGGTTPYDFSKNEEGIPE